MIKHGLRYRMIACILLLTLLSGILPAASAAETDGFLPCQYVLPDGRDDALTYLSDGSDSTRLTLEEGESLLVTWTGDASGVLLRWYDPAVQVLLEWLGPDQTVLRAEKLPETEYIQYLPAGGAAGLRVTCLAGLAGMSEVRAYSDAYTPAFADERGAQADILLVLSGAADETLAMGGLLPQYAVEHGVRTAVVYLGEDYGYIAHEALSALSALGVRAYPTFRHLHSPASALVSKYPALWNEPVLLRWLMQLILTVRPRVVVTLDPDDASAAPRAVYTARVTGMAVAALAGGDCPVQKLYTLSADGQTVADWTTPLVLFDGMTAQQIAQRAYGCYASQAMFHRSVPARSAFSLIYTAVGDDVNGDDLLENIDRATLLAYTEPVATPTVTPAVTPTSTPAVSDTPRPTDTPAPAVTAVTAASATAPVPPAPQIAAWVLVALTVACAASMLIVRRSRLLLLLRGLLLVLLLAVAVLLFMRAGAPVPSAAVSPTETPVPETPVPATPVPVTPVPATPVPVTPSPTPDPDDVWFRQDGEPEEVIVSDYDAGKWEYRSDSLSVLIDRVSYTEDGLPYVIYVAHIRTRGVNCFRTGLASNLENAARQESPWRLARGYKAVLAVTGDNLTNSDVYYKGILIRNGVFYADHGCEDTLAIYPDMSLGIIKRNTRTGLMLLDSGVLNAYSFGPVLVEDGVINPDARAHWVARHANPRCGIGMVEPGHLIAIVTDGRDIVRARGHEMDAFAQLFYERGCTLAYNLDGGSSAAMVFMGEHVNWHSGEDDLQRSWVDALLFGYSDAVPGVDDPVTHNGNLYG